MGAIPSELLQQIANPSGGSNVLEMFMRGNQMGQQNEEAGWRRQQHNALLSSGKKAAAGNYQGAASDAFSAGDHQIGQGYTTLAAEQKKHAMLQKQFYPEQEQGPQQPGQSFMLPPSAPVPSAGGGPDVRKLRLAKQAFDMGNEELAQKLWIEAQDEQNSGMFSGNSVEAQALNHLVAVGQITEDQAANIAASKPITDPATGQLLLVTPQQIVEAAKRSGMPQQTGAAQGQDQTQLGIPLTGPKPPEPKFNQEQGNAAMFADRMSNALPVIEKLGEVGTSAWDTAASHVPAIGNYLISDEYRQLEQAKQDFINASLRRESGATIQKPEMEAANRQYFPQPGDDPGTLAQKKLNRETQYTGMIRSAGPNYKPGTTKPKAAPTGNAGTTSTNVPFKVLD